MVRNYFEAEKDRFQLLGSFVDERGQLGDRQSGVQLQEASNVWDVELLLDFIDEHFELLVIRLH